MKIISVLALIFILLDICGAYSQTWEPLGGGTDGVVYAIEQYNNDIIAGGNFNMAGIASGSRFIAKWNGSSWSPVGPQYIFTGMVRALTLHQGNLIAAGEFSSPSYSRIIKWNGSALSYLGNNNVTIGAIHALFSWEGDLYAGGSFTEIDGVQANNIAKWNGTAWLPLGSGTNGTVRAITADGFTGRITVGGAFTTAGGVNVQNVAKWNGTSWSALSNGLDGPVYALERVPWGVLAGGGFTKHISSWAGLGWNPFNGGIDTGHVWSISSKRWNPNDNIFIVLGGAFNMPGFVPANVASYYGGWNSMGSLNDYVWKVFEATPYEIYAAGLFTMSGNVPVNHIAKLTTMTPTFHRVDLNKPLINITPQRDTIHGLGDDPRSFIVADVNITIDTVLHSNDADLEFILTHNGISDTIIYRAGGTGDNFIGTRLNDSALIPVENGTAPFNGEFRPSKPLSRFIGSPAGGEWILEIYDRAAGNNGVLDAWSLTLKLQDVIGIQPVNSSVPSQFSLSQNYPNPFNPVTKIKFQITKSSSAKLIVFDVLGREVQGVFNQYLKPGTYEIDFDGGKLPSGIYFYRLTAGDFSETKKMVLIK